MFAFFLELLEDHVPIFDTRQVKLTSQTAARQRCMQNWGPAEVCLH
jgi:hypothetical protein